MIDPRHLIASSESAPMKAPPRLIRSSSPISRHAPVIPPRVGSALVYRCPGGQTLRRYLRHARDAARIFQLFEPHVIPTPFTVKADAARVRASVERNTVVVQEVRSWRSSTSSSRSRH